MEDLVHLQNEDAVCIQNLIANYKKAPLERRTAELYQTKLKELDATFIRFNRRDDELRQHHGTNIAHAYFTDDFYGTINTIYETAKEDINLLLAKITPPHTIAKSDGQKDGPSTSQVKTAKPRTKPPSQSDAMKQKLIIHTVQNMIKQVLETSNRSVQFYSMKLKIITQHWNHASLLHEKLWTSAADEYDFEDYVAIESEVNEGMLAIQERMIQEEPGSGTSLTELNCRLPKIELPKFDGNYLEWRQFYDLFSELVHNRPLPSCQKLLYLKSSLSGEAEGLIQHFATTAANYEVAWQTLKERFENKRVIVNTLLHKLFLQPAATHESVGTLKSLHDTTRECLHSLQNLSIITDHWDPILVHLLVQRMSKTTHILWEQSLPDSRELPSLEDFLTFIKLRFQSLEALGSKITKPTFQGHDPVRALGVSVPSKGNCSICQDFHQLYACPTFLKWSPRDRLIAVQKAKRCVNCLKIGHMAKDCKSSTCNQCHKRHNSLLHLEPFKKIAMKKQINSEDITQSTIEHPRALTAVGPQSLQPTQVLLSTIQLTVLDSAGNKVACRALLDSGSQANFITKQLAKKLGLPTKTRVLDVEGIGQTRSRITERVNVEVSSNFNNFSTRIEAYLLPNIISDQPTQKLCLDNWQIPSNIRLSDEGFYKPGRIDLLIGAGLFYSMLCVGQISIGKGLPLLQNTLFGWIVGGGLDHKQSPALKAHCGVGIQCDTLEDNMEKFWRIEEREDDRKNFTRAEYRCEEHFLSNIKRDADGRFSVRLPFQGEVGQLGESRDIALQRFKSMERNLTREPQLREMYIKFMREYESLNHMHEISPQDLEGPHYFLPHHAVLKPDSTTTKLRVVFDASAKTSTNLSLNDLLAAGPITQPDVFTLLLRFRLPRFVFTADIEKMYRQIWVNTKDRNLQLIWWREDPTMPLRCMQLATVTYGTTSAPYLAIRTLQHLGDTEKVKYPLAAEAIQNNFYVDDVLTGSDSMITALETQTQLRQLLKTAGLNLRKWCANDARLLNNIPLNDREVTLNICNAETDHVKTMGTTWHPMKDVFTVKVNHVPLKRVTKRTALADISRLFDPLGLMAPVVVTAKIFLQTLWKLKLDWDAALPLQLDSMWLEFSNSLSQLEKIEIPRHIFNHISPRDVQLHVFADASEKAYGAVAYIRIVDAQKVVTVRLLCSKSRVAPVKQITLPRLELCAAKLATELVARLHDDKLFINSQTYFWSDSTAVLGWVRATSANYHTFVANRISAIHQVSTPQQWHYVRSEHNPADLVSRGLMPHQLPESTFWFYGPIFLHAPMTSWPLQPPHDGCNLELRAKAIVTANTVATREFFNDINHKNSLRKLQRITAYVTRFVTAVKDKKRAKSTRLSVDELDSALCLLIKTCQHHEFADEIKALKRFKSVENSSAISSLNPFIDQNGLLRVGGRLQNSHLSYDTKHPMLLPYHHPLTKMVFTTLHREHLHVGAQTLLATVRLRFWPIKGKNIARSVVQGCVQCTRAKPKLFEQLMGSLPKDRVQPARPFVKSGVDFFGPVWIHFKLRGKRPVKAYVAVFCCFATKAVHLELVGDLTTDAFLGALRRFMARRGHCSTLYCDNATNFVGARNQLQELTQAVYHKDAQEKIINTCTIKGVQFEFIPPRAPHFGGLWEAAVKSAKQLLQSSLVSANLTHEELETIMTEAEAILNSRPLTPLSADPNDLSALTPGHFLIGEPLINNVDPRAASRNSKLLSRWKLVSHIKNEFWRRWSQEYLHSLQHRYKWKKEMHDIKPNMMVLIKEDNLPTLKWPLGRITNTIRGNDGLIRVVDVKTQTNVIRRPIAKLAPLPVEDDSNNDNNESQSQGKTEPRAAKRPRVSLMSTLLVLCLCLPICLASNIEVQPFPSNPGLYFEKIGSAGLIVSEWSIVTYVNMTTYWKWGSKIQEFPDALQKLCKLSQGSACSSVSVLLKHSIDELKVNDRLLTHHHGSRAKRGAVNIVGNIANALFGVLDETYAKETATTIDKLHRNEIHLNEQIKMQRSFLDNTINVMKTDRQAIEREFKNIERILNMTTNEINKITDKLQRDIAASQFHDLALQMTLIVMYLQRIQDSLLEFMTDTHHGKINPELLPPNQLESELNNIKTLLPATLRSPDTSDLLKIYNLLTIETRIVEELAIFNIRLPLLTTTDFEILRITPVPWIVQHTFKQIVPNYRFLLSNLHRDQYMPMKEDELRDCHHMEKERYFCHQNHPLYTRGSSLAACEFALLNHQIVNTSCEVSNISEGPHWMQLHNLNWWIYSIDGESTLNAVCNDALIKIKISNSGILKLNDDCTIKQRSTTVRGYHIYKTTVLKSYIPEIEAKELPLEESIHQREDDQRYVAKYKAQFEKLDMIQQRLSELPINLPHTIRSHDIHHYALGYSTCALILAGFLVFMWKKKMKYHLQRESTTNPTTTNVQKPNDEAEPRIITIS